MIVTLTMNPAIDKTVEITRFVHAGLNRIQRVEYDVGGKGINVSKTLYELGSQSIATGFCAGNNGMIICNTLKAKGICCDFIEVQGEARTNTKIVDQDGTLTELNEPGPLITEANLQELKKKLLGYAGEDTIFVFAGSIPRGVPQNIYAELVKLVKANGAKVVLDADGDAFRQAIEEEPDFIKPNNVELEEYFGFSSGTNIEELLKAVKMIKSKGVENILISMGKNGALFLIGNYQVHCPGLNVKAHSTVGAGDAMVAALAHALDKRFGHEDMVKLCMAASAGAVTTIGTKPPTIELVDSLLKKVTIKKIGVQ